MIKKVQPSVFRRGKKYFSSVFVFLALFMWLGQGNVFAEPPFPIFPMLQKFVGEEQGKGWLEGSGQSVRYLTAEEAEAYKLTFREGKIYDSLGNLFDTNHWAGVYVMTTEGDFYATNEHGPRVFHHSSFLRGLPIACAGTFVVREGVIQLINNLSGHYRPPSQALDNAVKQLRQNGVEPLKVIYRDPQPVSVDVPKVEITGPRRRDCQSLFSKLLFPMRRVFK